MISIRIISTGSIEGRIIRCQLGVHPTQIKDCGNPAYWMIVRHRIIEAE
jgi:hypothetical protein